MNSSLAASSQVKVAAGPGAAQPPVVGGHDDYARVVGDGRLQLCDQQQGEVAGDPDRTTWLVGLVDVLGLDPATYGIAHRAAQQHGRRLAAVLEAGQDLRAALTAHGRTTGAIDRARRAEQARVEAAQQRAAVWARAMHQALDGADHRGQFHRVLVRHLMGRGGFPEERARALPTASSRPHEEETRHARAPRGQE